MVPLYGLGKMHPFSQVGEGCARNRLDYCDHSPPWPGALGQGKKKKALTLQVQISQKPLTKNKNKTKNPNQTTKVFL